MQIPGINKKISGFTAFASVEKQSCCPAEKMISAYTVRIYHTSESQMHYMMIGI